METVPCPISNSSEFRPWLDVPDRFGSSEKKRWQLVQSCTSGLIILNPRPESSEIVIHYQNGKYDPHLSHHNKLLLRERAYLAIRSLLLPYKAHLILKEAATPQQKLSILEIGCSTGDLLNFFHRKKGIPLENLAGVEPDTESATYAQSVFGLNVSALLQNEYRHTFDRIILWHTLEHIHALHTTLSTVAQLLKPEGVLVIALPNPASYGAEYYRENWVAWDAPRHLYHFLPETLGKLLEQYNLFIVKQQPYVPDTVYNTFYSEKLRCEMQGKQFHALHIVMTLGRTMSTISKDVIRPEKASSLIYFIKKQTGNLQQRLR